MWSTELWAGHGLHPCWLRAREVRHRSPGVAAPDSTGRASSSRLVGRRIVAFGFIRKRAPTHTGLHAVAEEVVLPRSVAEAIGRGLGLPTVVVAEQDDAPERFGFVACFIGQDAPTSNALTRGLLG